MNDKITKGITVYELSLAAWLLTEKCEVIEFRRESPKRVAIVFLKTPKTERAITDYWNDIEVKLPIKTLFQNYQQLKDRIYATQ